MSKDRGLPLALRAAYMALHRCTESAFAKHGVTADQFVLMLALNESRLLTQSELAEKIWSDKSTVRAMLVLLEKKGLILRDSHPTDSRAKTVKLTARGKGALRKLWKVGQPIRDRMYDCLSDNESEMLINLLGKVAAALAKDNCGTH